MIMKTILLLGDSLIEWGNWQHYFPKSSVLNAGLAGETVQGLQARLASILGRITDPDGVVVMTGTNNLAMDDFYFIPDYEEVLRCLVSSFPETDVAVTSLLPVDFSWQPATVVCSLNDQLREMCGRTGVRYIDLHTRFVDAIGQGSQLFDADGVHLAPKGYELWSRVLKEIFPWL